MLSWIMNLQAGFSLEVNVDPNRGVGRFMETWEN
jgi:hypothetical protein